MTASTAARLRVYSDLRRDGFDHDDAAWLADLLAEADQAVSGGRS